MNPFRHGSPVGMYRIPIWSSQNSRSASEISSGPLSHRINTGKPRSAIMSLSAVTRSLPVIDRAVTSSSDSRVCSSTMDAILNFRPSAVESCWKSMAHNTFAASASQCSKMGLRYVLLSSDLVDSPVDFNLSTAVVLMRLVDRRDAEVAAEFVGRSKKFVLNSVTQGSSDGQTTTQGRSRGSSTGTTSSTSYSDNGASSSVGYATSQTEGQSWSWTVSSGSEYSETTTRVHEFVVEPEELQSMGRTGFVLVSKAANLLKVGDCHPSIEILPNTSRHSLPTEPASPRSSPRQQQQPPPPSYTQQPPPSAQPPPPGY